MAKYKSFSDDEKKSYFEELSKNLVQKLVTAFESENFTENLAQTITLLYSGKGKNVEKWSMQNVFLAMIDMQLRKQANGDPYTIFDLRGFNQWKDVGRTVKKGGKSTYIFAPLIGVKKKDGKAVLDASGKEFKTVYGFKAVPVFFYEDTEGEPLPEPPELNPPEPPRLQAVAESINVKVKYEATLSKAAAGHYHLIKRAITLHTYEEPVYWHELAHAVDDYLGLLADKDIGAVDWRKDAEVVAESVAGSITIAYKLWKTDDERKQVIFTKKRYIDQYVRKDESPSSAVRRLMNRINAVMKFIFSRANDEDIAKMAESGDTSVQEEGQTTGYLSLKPKSGMDFVLEQIFAAIKSVARESIYTPELREDYLDSLANIYSIEDAKERAFALSDFTQLRLSDLAANIGLKWDTKWSIREMEQITEQKDDSRMRIRLAAGRLGFG